MPELRLRSVLRRLPSVLLSAWLVAATVHAEARWQLADQPAAEVGPAVDGGAGGYTTAGRTDDGRLQVLVELSEPAGAVAFAAAMAGSAANDEAARAAAGAASRAQVRAAQAQQDRFAAAIAARGLRVREMYRVSRAVNGVALAVTPEQLRALATLPDVRRILPIEAEYPTNSTSVPFLGTPNVWANNLTPALAAGALGAGIRIAIIDTGLDYMHADFGGTGVLADYQAESTDTAAFTTVGTAAAGSFPTTKVVGGTDFAGDAYTGGNAPTPDTNPMDCNGHGSHVAGSAAGFGVTTGGATFAGPYDANASTYSPLRIGPGTAPQALLYGLRVFGCTGSTGLTTLAIDWAMDPNGDLDVSDHLDVINMSLGSNFGSAVTATAVASDNAALAGVVVVASAGNASDTFFISGAPGSASRVIATAASVDSGVPAPFVRINSPTSLGTGYLAGTAAFGPAVTPTGTTGNVVLALDPADGAGPLTTDGCTTPFTNAAAVAGNIALIDRGSCGFAVKAKNAQTNGAIGVIIANNAPGSTPPGMAGVDPTITIPTVSITLSDANALKTGLLSGTVNVTLLGPSGDDTLASFSSRGPRRIFGSPLRLKPDIAAPGLNITSAQTGKTCLAAPGCTGLSSPSGYQAGSQALTISGTSMAAPHMAGIMALLKETHPAWSVEELKALAMNYATHDMTLLAGGTPPEFPPSRIGAGRVDPAQSALGQVIAMNADDVGMVSVTFEPEVTGVVTQTKTVRVVNKGTTAQTFDLAIDTQLDSPGVGFSLPGGSMLTVGAGQTEEIDVQMTADASLMDHTRDPSLFPTQGVQTNYGDQPRNFLTEEGGYLTFSQSSTVQLRLPLYMAQRPASAMSAGDIVTGGAATGSTTIALSGSGLCTGTLAAGPTCTGSFPTDVESLVSPFELQVVSGLDPVSSTEYADIQYAGVSYLPNANGLGSSINNDLILFGVSSWGDWSTLNEVAYNICVDTNEDGVYDRNVINIQPSIFVAGASPNDNFVRAVQNLSTAGFTILGLGSFVNLVAPNVVDSALHLNNVMLLAATPAQLGMIAGDTTFRYKIVTCPGGSPCARTTTGDRCSPSSVSRFDEAVGPYFYNWATPGLDFGGNFLDEDLNGNSLPVSWNTANMTTNGSLGALLLHHHNGRGSRAEVVLLDTAQRANLAIAKSVDLPTPNIGQNVTFTVTLTNNGPDSASSIVVNDFLPDGLTYVSDNGGGAYVPATGLWTLPGSLAAAGSATLQIVATVDRSGEICNTAQIVGGTPLDPSPVDNQATSCINPPRTANLLLSMAASTPTALVGAPVTFTLTVTNNGDDPAYGLNTSELFTPAVVPAGSYSGIVASQGVFSPATGLWNLASLPTGATATLQYTIAAPNMAGLLTNSGAAVSTRSTVITRAFDPDTSDNNASAAVTVLSPADVTATKTVNAGPHPAGSNVTYTIVLTNSASYDQQNNAGFELTDTLPAQLTLVSSDDGGSPGTFANSGNTVNWDGVIPANGAVTFTIVATIVPGTAAGTIVTNQATVNVDVDGNGVSEAARLSDDPAVGGGSDGTSFGVASGANLMATKTVSGNYQVGGSVTYTVVITNNGNANQPDNAGDEFVDVLPAQLALVSASATAGTAVATVGTNTVTWNGALAIGGSVTVTINATILPSAVGPVSNQGTVFFDADGNGSNESSAVTDDPTTAAAGDATAFGSAGPADIPTLSQLATLLLGLALAGAGLLLLRLRG